MLNKFILLFAITLMSTIGFTQSNAVKIDFSYFITNTPLFKLGYEHKTDTLSQFSYGLNLEYGQYAVNTQGISFSSINDYQLHGFGVMPEVKYYLNKEQDKKFFGFFVSGFVLLKKVKEISLKNISVSPDGYDLSKSSSSSRQGVAYNYGLALGFRSGRPAGKLHVEGILGYGLGYNSLTNNETVIQYSSKDLFSKDDLLRLELNLVATF